MNLKEVGELRRRWRPDKNAVSHIYGCFVNCNKQIVADLDEPLGLMTQEEGEKYLGLLKKALSGQLGKNLIDIVFSNEQVADSEEHRLLSALRDSRLKDGQVRQTFYQKVIDTLDMEGNNYLLLLACDVYDVPRRGKDDAVQADASDEVFPYLLCCVCPVKTGKVELGYFPGDNEFHCAASQVVAPPELGFLFPAFDGRTANIYNALFYSKRPDILHQEFIDAVFHTDPPMSAAEQKEAFQGALCDALGDCYHMEVARAVHEQLVELIAQHKERKDPEPLAVTADEVGRILADQGVPADKVQAFRAACGDRFGPQAALNPANLIDAGRFVVKTASATLSVDPGNSYLVEARVIDGRRCLLIPTEGDVEINGLAVRVGAGEGAADPNG